METVVSVSLAAVKGEAGIKPPLVGEVGRTVAFNRNEF